MKPRFFINRETDWTADEIVKNFDTSPKVTSTVDSDRDISSADSGIQKSSIKVREDNERDDEGSEVPIILEDMDPKQCKLLSALFPKTDFDKASNSGGGSKNNRDKKTVQMKCKEKRPRDSKENKNKTGSEKLIPIKEVSTSKLDVETEMWRKRVGSWYESFETNYFVLTPGKDAEYDDPLIHYQTFYDYAEPKHCARSARQQDMKKCQNNSANSKSQNIHAPKNLNTSFQNISSGVDNNWSYSQTNSPMNLHLTSNIHMKQRSFNSKKKKEVRCYDYRNQDHRNDSWTIETADKYNRSFEYDNNTTELRKQYRATVGNNLVVPRPSINPKNVRFMTIGKPVSYDNENDSKKLITDTNQNNGKEDINITQTACNTNDPHDVINTSYSKCDTVLEDISALEIMNSSIRTSTPNSLQDNNIAKESQIVNDVVNDIFHGSQPNNFDDFKEETQQDANNNEQEAIKTSLDVALSSRNIYKARTTVVEENSSCSYDKEIELTDFQVAQTNQEDLPNEVEMFDFACRYKDKNRSFEAENDVELVDFSSEEMKTVSNQANLKDISSEHRQQDTIRYFADQQKLFNVLEISNVDKSDKEHSFTFLDNKNERVHTYLSSNQTVAEPVDVKEVNLDNSKLIYSETNQNQRYVEELKIEEISNAHIESHKDVIQISTSGKVSNEQYVIPEVPNNAYLFLTLPKHLVSTASAPVQLQIESNVKLPEEKTKQKNDKRVNSKNMEAVDKTALRALLLEQLFKVVGKGTVANNEVGLPNN